MQAEQQQAQEEGDSNEGDRWRHRLHHYLDQLFQKDPTAGADYHHLQARPCTSTWCINSQQALMTGTTLQDNILHNHMLHN